MLATSFVLPKKNIMLSIGSFAAKQELEGAVRALHSLKYNLFGTLGTADYYNTHGIPITAVHLQESDELNISDLLADGRFDLVINLPMRSKVSRRLDEAEGRVERWRSPAGEQKGRENCGEKQGGERGRLGKEG